VQPAFGPCAEGLIPQLSEIAARFAPFVRRDGSHIEILPEGRPLTRIIASAFDQHVPEGVRYSRAS
jgi:oxygen-independent coproporphyrinogen-3 oxidase